MRNNHKRGSSSAIWKTYLCDFHLISWEIVKNMNAVLTKLWQDHSLHSLPFNCNSFIWRTHIQGFGYSHRKVLPITSLQLNLSWKRSLSSLLWDYMSLFFHKRYYNRLKFQRKNELFAILTNSHLLWNIPKIINLLV